MKAERRCVSHAQRGSNRKLEKSLAMKKKSFKAFRDGLHKSQPKTRKRRQRTSENPPSENAPKVQGEKGCRIGGSTTYVLPEPRGKSFSSIERIDTPPPPEPDI